MNKQAIERLIPKAFDAIKASGLIKSDKLPDTLNGYIAAFGSSCLQAGVCATVLFYSNEESGAKNKDAKTAIPKMIAQIAEGNLGEWKKNPTKANADKQKILNAAIALKLAIRSYGKYEESDNG
ncbi:MAG: hypothetical protein LBC09_01700 [Helicobacteraceae bacterium]|jgi:hypothetical protein|nr:hypothetical protein [Helicobacteraceae bacterium]